MKKINLLILSGLVSVNAICANSIAVNYATQVAQNFYQQNTGNSVTLTLAYQQLNSDTTDGLPIGTPLYYVFNAGNNQGFIMVSADNVTSPILGYNTIGKFVIQNAPPVITAWLKKYSKQIAYAKANQIPATQPITDQWNNYYNNISTNVFRSSSAVAPLLTTTWDQNQFYNDLCPTDGDVANDGYNGRACTGCGATAMAQIMRYWSFPPQGTSSNSYNSNYGTLSVNFGTTTYNWSNMPNSVTSTNTDVATLMYDCGVAVNMNYGPPQTGGSSSNPIGAAPSSLNAYTTYFGYDPSLIQGLSKSSNETDWTNLIQNELNAGRPIQYAGYDLAANAGHTFVLDGADGNGNFYINWGWGGIDDGYFPIDALNPAGQSETYDDNEQMIIGIQPLNYTTNGANIQLNSAITVTPNPVPFVQTFTVSLDLINDGSVSFVGDYCAALFDADGNFVRLIGDILATDPNLTVGQSYGSGGITFSDTSTGVTLPGNYFVGVYYQPSGLNTWTLAGTNSYSNLVSVSVSGPFDSIEVYSNISVSPTILVQGEAATVNANLWNTGTATYYGIYEAVLLDYTGNTLEQVIGTYDASSGLPANTDYSSPFITFSTNSISVPEGNYILAIAETRSGTSDTYYCGGGYYTNPIPLSVVNTGFFTSIQQIIPNKAILVYPNPANGQINIDPGSVRGNYTLEILNTIGQQMSERTGILDGQKLSVDISSFAAGMYIIQLKTESGILKSKFIVK